MTGTARRSKGVHREAESEGSVSQITDLTNRNRIIDRRSWGSRQDTVKPNRHSGTTEVNPARAARKWHDLPWEVSAPVRTNLTTGLATEREGCREVSRGHSRRRKSLKGRTYYSKEQTGILDGYGALARHGVDRAPRWEQRRRNRN